MPLHPVALDGALFCPFFLPASMRPVAVFGAGLLACVLLTRMAGVDGVVVRLQWKSGGNIGWGWLAVGVGGEVCFILYFVNFCSGMIFLCAMLGGGDGMLAVRVVGLSGFAMLSDFSGFVTLFVFVFVVDLLLQPCVIWQVLLRFLCGFEIFFGCYPAFVGASSEPLLVRFFHCTAGLC